MMPDDPEQLRAFMRGETDDPGVVRAVRGGIRFPAVQAQRTVMPDGTLVAGEVDGRRIVGVVAPGAGIDLGSVPYDPETNPYTALFADGGWSVVVDGVAVPPETRPFSPCTDPTCTQDHAR